MRKVSDNEQSWRFAVLDDETIRSLEKLTEHLKQAWDLDVKCPRSFPVNTERVFHGFRIWIKEYEFGRPDTPDTKLSRPLEFRPIEQLSELVDESYIKFAYENQNMDSYRDAVRIAGSGDKFSILAFKRIHNAIKTAYLMQHFSQHLAGKPKGQYLHRNLLEVCDLVEDLKNKTHEEMTQFVADLCPCGKEHKVGTIRKLRNRIVRRDEKDQILR